jgi:hypothetical protein
VTTAAEILISRFGHTEFRPGQQQVVERVLAQPGRFGVPSGTTAGPQCPQRDSNPRSRSVMMAAEADLTTVVADARAALERPSSVVDIEDRVPARPRLYAVYGQVATWLELGLGEPWGCKAASTSARPRTVWSAAP